MLIEFVRQVIQTTTNSEQIGSINEMPLSSVNNKKSLPFVGVELLNENKTVSFFHIFTDPANLQSMIRNLTKSIGGYTLSFGGTNY